MRSKSEFKAEIFRRCEAYKMQKLKKRRLLSFSAPAAACLILILVLGSSGLFPLPEKKTVKNSDMVPESQTQPITEMAASSAAVSVEVKSGESVSLYTNAEKVGRILSYLDNLTLSAVTQNTESQNESPPPLVFTVAYSDGESKTFTLFNGIYLSADDGVREISPAAAEGLRGLIFSLTPDH